MEMDPISNVDRLVLLLRQRLSERAKTTRGGPVAGSGRAQQAPAATVRALAAVEGMDDRHLRRALIQNLLSGSFGEQVVNDAKFQQVVDRVTQTIEADAETAKLLQRMVRELKEAAR